MKQISFTSILSLVTLGLALQIQASAQTHQFYNPRGYFYSLGTAKHRTASISMGDVDGDGDLDAVVANGRHWPEQNYVFILTKRGYKIAQPLGVNLSTTYAVPLADLDGDGDLDIMTGNDMAPNRIFLNDGKGHFSEKGLFGQLEAPTRSLLLADINNDGYTDVLITNRGSANEICFNDGKANFENCIPFGNAEDSTIDVAAADIDKDGDQDLVLANRDKQQNYIYLNEGDGTFAKEGIAFGTGTDETRSVAVADLDKDGWLDIVAGNIREPNVIYFGDKDHNYTRSHVLGAAEESTYHLLLADIDQDGELDIVTGNTATPSAVYFNRGKAKQFDRQALSEEEYRTYQVAVGKINDDEFPDIILANSEHLNLYYLYRKR
ncbi:MAG: VCBS repeat-containing protein [Saprospiraceae bacterium]|nr:VCBS repeat-containing protein [Saprospiraceae bacterium]